MIVFVVLPIQVRYLLLPEALIKGLKQQIHRNSKGWPEWAQETFMLFTKCYFFCSCFHLFLESRTSSTNPQFATSYFLSWMPCYCCKQRMTVFGLQTYSKISKRLSDFSCVASTFCSSHAGQNSLACIVINFLNIKEEDMFGKLLSLWHKIHQ